MESRYWAGFFDGEGCVRINRQYPLKEYGRSGSYIKVSVVNTNRSVLVALQEQFGGSLLPHDKPHPIHSPSWTWVATTNKAEAFLRAVLPYLIVKRNEALIALAFQAARNKDIPVMDDNEQQLREGFIQQLHEAKHGISAN